MNLENAKLILAASRAGDEAGANPQLREALALAQADPELADWLVRERRGDEAIRRELAAVPVPAGLKARLLAQQNVAALPVAHTGTSWFAGRSPLVWAMAAALVIFLGLTYNWSRPHPGAGLTDFAQDMITASPQNAHHVDALNSNFEQVKVWLAGRQALADIELPPAIKNAPGLMGCRIMSWRGKPVAMLCFVMPGEHHVDLFVTRAANVVDAPAAGQPVFASVNAHAIAGWQAGDNVYVLAGQVPEQFLRHCLEPLAAAMALGWESAIL